MRRALIIAGLLTALVASGCGDDEADTSPASGAPASGNAVEVVADDILFTQDSYQAEAGTVNVRYVNDGSINHTLLIDGVDGFKLVVGGNGDEDEGTVELEAGSYTIYCDIPGHRAAGMEATLEVT